ncbi:MAG: ArgE/DapE family deacylase [Gammaproteobacteria bacterium]|jgi:formylaminopyrimidine deformylase|nr:ArgE/DapE family deacylase [Gammaproteobacteria bacterium]
MQDPNIKTNILKSVENLKEELISLLVDTIRIPSVNPSLPNTNPDLYPCGESNVAEYLAPVMADMGLEVDLFAEVDDRKNVCGVWKGTGEGKSLIFNGHMDVVPPGPLDDWTVADPWSGKIVDGKIYGRGAADMKSGNAAAIMGLKAVLDAGYKPRGDVILQNVVGEENMETAAGTGAFLKRGYTADAAIVVESSSFPQSLSLCTAQANNQVCLIKVKGKTLHCALRGETIRAGGYGSQMGVNSIDKAMLIYNGLKRLEDEWGRTKSHPLWTRPGYFSIYPTVFNGGRAEDGPTLMSAETMMCYIINSPPDESPEQTREEVEKVIQLLCQTDDWLRENPPQLEWVLNWPGWELESNAPICQAVHHAYETTFNKEPNYYGFWSASDATFLTQAGIPTICLGPGSVQHAHAANEQVEIEELVNASKIYAMSIAEWCGV